MVLATPTIKLRRPTHATQWPVGKAVGRVLADSMHCVVIVGGGGGVLELATRLGDSPGKRGVANIALIVMHRTHVWKPKLHGVVKVSLDTLARLITRRTEPHVKLH